VSLTQQPFGPVALPLAMLAATLERWDEAEASFDAALGRCELLGARAIRARVLLEYARALVARARPGDAERASALLDDARRLGTDLELPGILRRVAAASETAAQRGRPGAEARFTREGDFWTIGYAGKTMRLRDLKGLRYLALLIAAPGREIHVLELVSATDGLAAGPPPGGIAEDRLRASPPGELGPLLDRRAREEYRARLEDLRAELEEARQFADDERAARLELEVDALVGELARAAGLGGRDRPLSSPAERARVNVTKAIRTAIKLIERESSELSEHLTAAIRTGRFCSYAPPGEAPPRWTT
jgi:hypothetical protein